MKKVMVAVAVVLTAATMSACSAKPIVIAPGQSGDGDVSASSTVNGEGA